MASFPEGFLFGASLSAHQAEGGNFHSDWWRWEQRPGRINGGATSEVAAGHFERFEEDFGLARKLGHNAHLFSIEWSRVQPEPHRFDEKAIEHYHAVLDALAARGIEPLCALHWVTLPLWFAQAYGWSHSKAPDMFARYVRRVATEYAAKCRWWIPLYEPGYALDMAYIERVWPPASWRLDKARRARRSMAEAHTQAYRIIHELRPDACVGVSVRGRGFAPLDSDNPWDLRAARRETHRCRHGFLAGLREGQTPDPGRDGARAADFLGLAYYGCETVRFAPLRPLGRFIERSAGAGALPAAGYGAPDPRGFGELLDELASYELPMVITGCGSAPEFGRDPCAELLDHLAAARRALERGMDIRGFIYRPLVDQFEWAEGYRPRFGLAHVDRVTLARTPNPVAYLFKDVCEHRSLRRGTLAQFCPEWRDPFGSAS